MQSTPSLFNPLMTASAALAADSCGPDLEYAPHFLDFMASAAGKEEQQFGSTIIAAQEPDWRAVLKSGMALANESRDLRVAAVLTRAAVEVHGLSGLADGLALVHDWLAAHWDTLHPALTADDEYDPLLRANALAYLYAPGTGLKTIKQAKLLKSPIGDLTVREACDIVKGIAVNGMIVTSCEQLTRLVADEYERNKETFEALQQVATLQQAIESIWKNKLRSEYWPAFDNLNALLEPLVALIDAAQPTVVDEVRSPALDVKPMVSFGTNSAEHLTDRDAGALPSVIGVNSRRDAFRALAMARQYFEHHEPSHPAPLLIKRIEKLEALDFAEILSELAPDALGQLEHITGRQYNKES